MIRALFAPRPRQSWRKEKPKGGQWASYGSAFPFAMRPFRENDAFTGPQPIIWQEVRSQADHRTDSDALRKDRSAVWGDAIVDGRRDRRHR
jgi:hypothetical protein